MTDETPTIKTSRSSSLPDEGGLSADQQEILNLAVELVRTTPEQTGEIHIKIEHGKLRFIQVMPSFRFNMVHQVRTWMDKALTLFR